MKDTWKKEKIKSIATVAVFAIVMISILVLAGYLTQQKSNLNTMTAVKTEKTTEGGTEIETETAKEAVNTVKLEGKGTLESPYLIHDKDELQIFAESVNQGVGYLGEHVKLVADIDLTGITDIISIGVEESGKQFRGTFNGEGHKILGMQICSEGEAGLFVNLDGNVCNLIMEGGSVQGSISGAIASSTTDLAVIVNCSSHTQTIGEIAGGIVGKNVGNVIDCVNYTIDGETETNTVAIGDNSSGVLEYCYQEQGDSFLLTNNFKGDESQPEESRPMTKALNNRLIGLSQEYTLGDWALWTEDEKPILSDKPANLLERATIDVVIAGKKEKMEGYYSKVQNAWCFMTPEGCEADAWDMQLTLRTGETCSFHNELDTTQAEYTIADLDYCFQYWENASIPSMFVDTDGTDGLQYLQENKLNERSGSMLILDESGSIIYDELLNKVSGRGNDSFSARKKGYNIELKERVDLFQMGKNEDYVLLPGYRDNSLFSYKVTQDMAKELQIPYAPESRFVNLYIDHAYLGMYLMTEKMEIDKNRFELNDLYTETKKRNNRDLSMYKKYSVKSKETVAERTWYAIPKQPEDCTGGYLLELDEEDFTKDQSRFVSNHDVSITLKSNKYATKKQVDYIADYWQDFEDALYAEDGYNAKGKYYAEYIDMESFAEQWLLYELHEDTSMKGSVYFYKDADRRGDGKLHAAYLWDVEHSFKHGEEVNKSWIMDRMKDDLDGELDGYWLQLYYHKDFAEVVYQKWEEKVKPALQKLLAADSIENPYGLSSITWYEQEYSNAGMLNSTRWSNCNWWDKGENMRQFLTARMEFLEQSLKVYQTDYDYITEEDGVYYGCYYASDRTQEDKKEPIPLP